MPEIATEENMRQIRIAGRIIRRKRRLYDIQNQPFSDMETDDTLAEYLDNATFVNKDGEVCEFTRLQKHDLNLVLQKRYALLNWQQGSGKTAAVYHRAKYLLKYGKVRNVVILAPCHCHQYDLDSVPRHQQGAIQSDTHIQRILKMCREVSSCCYPPLW